MLSHDTLFNYYTTNFTMKYFHGYSAEELDGMIPWERDITINLLGQQLKKEAEEARLRAQQNKFG